MISSRYLTRICIAGLVFCLIYIGILNSGSLQCSCSEANSKNPSAPQTSENVSRSGDMKGHFLCVIVPYRDRFEELTQFVPSITNFLKKQNVQHRIFIVNQVKSLDTNI